jgi:hypothetical protein
MKKIIFFYVFFAITVLAYSQDDNNSEKNFYQPNINFLLRTELQTPPNRDKQASMSMPESRFEILGLITPNLEYRVRYRLNGNFNSNTLDKSPGALDIAYILYRFGEERKFSLTAGKQAAFVGNWEFENNPAFEYQYSEHVNYELNIFLLAMKLGYQLNENHSFYVQLHNTVNNTFDEQLNKFGFVANGLEPSKYPFGVYFSWLGKLFDNKLNTFWSYNISQFASSKTNQSFGMGNKVNLGKLHSYLDLSYSNYKVDHSGLASRTLNSFNGDNFFAKDISYFTTVMRVDYSLTSKWNVTAKGIFEKSSKSKSDFNRKNTALVVGLENKPFKSQDMKFFAYFYNNDLSSNYGNSNTNFNKSFFSIGALYFIHALKN